ncbi:MAG: hypothetical protein Q8O75_02680 [bacterium]|nr:hypothetical protein [bacterium]
MSEKIKNKLFHNQIFSLVASKIWVFSRSAPLTRAKKFSEGGQIAIILVLTLLSTASILVVALGVVAFNEVKKLNNVVKSAQSYYVAEAGIEDVVTRVKNKMIYPNPGTYSFPVGQGTAEVTISGSLENLSIVSKGDVANRIRKVAVNLTSLPSETDVDFNYGVQVGDGGLSMKSNSEVTGGVFANGPIFCPSGCGGGVTLPKIVGDAFSAVPAGSTGIGQNLAIKKSAPGATDGNGHANTIRSVTADGTLYCKTGSGNNKVCDTSEDDPEPQSLPVSDSTINTWKSWAAAGGEQGDTTIPGGTTSSIGPRKINGNLTINSNSTLIVTGTIWVTGNITVNSNSLILLHSSFGADGSAVVLAGDTGNTGQIVINSNVTICGSNGGVLGSCNTENGSYIMFLSTFPFDPTQDAILAYSNILTSILYANNGAIRLNSNVRVKEVTGYGLRLESDATVTFETGLGSVVFTTGPGAVFKINSWEEVT